MLSMGMASFNGPFPMLQSQSIIVVQSPDSTSWEALSLEGEEPDLVEGVLPYPISR